MARQDTINVWDDRAGRWIKVPVQSGFDQNQADQDFDRMWREQPIGQQPQGRQIYDDLGRLTETGGEW